MLSTQKLKSSTDSANSKNQILADKDDLPQTSFPTALEMTRNTNFKPGYLSIIQCATSSSETLINVVAPRLKKYSYQVLDSAGNALASVEKYDNVIGPLFYNVDKIKVTGLSLNLDYTLKVIDNKTTVDQRTFRALDTSKPNPRFGLVSCMADDYRFDQAIDPMWKKLEQQNLDFVLLTGDLVYVDSFEFVERLKATESDIWQRYIDALKRIPYYHMNKLIPTLAIWDDHDYGTNDGDRTFIGKQPADKLFHALFAGKSIDGVWSQGPDGTCSYMKAFGQNFFLMDDRSFRQPNKDTNPPEEFGHWGQMQHQWLFENLKNNNEPSWIINGNQFFNGVSLTFKEAFEQNHPKEFGSFIDSLKSVEAPVAFASGDVHLAEVMKVPTDRLGYETYEFTSSAMHSYAGPGWDNPMRVEGCYSIEFNFFVLQSENQNGNLNIKVSCLGLADKPYFEKEFVVKKRV